MERASKRRIVVSILLVLVFISLYLLRLMKLQLVDGESYLEAAQSTTVSTVAIAAPRGEIVDKYGRALAVNRTCYSVQIDLAYLPSDERNQVLLRLLDLLESLGISYADSLPISATAPYAFLDEDIPLNRLAKMFTDNQLPGDAEATLRALGEQYGVPEDFTDSQLRRVVGLRYDMTQRGTSVKNPYVMVQDIDITAVTAIREMSPELPGIDIITESIREYVSGTIAPHIIGTVGAIPAEDVEEYLEMGYSINDKIGIFGVEQSMELYLRGEPGEREITRNARGQVISSRVTKEPVPGNTVVLSIDSELQKQMQDILEYYVTKIQTEGQIEAEEERRKGTPESEIKTGYDCEAGSIVVTDVNTGAVLAMATYPSYDLSTYFEDYSANSASGALFNHATQGAYPPGSTFKMLSGIAALETGNIQTNTQFNCTGTFTKVNPDHPSKCLHRHGNIGLVEAIGRSCNIYFYEVGLRMGFTPFATYAALFGFGQKTGLEIAESAGHVSTSNIIMTAIGQADNQMTPVQLCNYVATLANGGTRYELTVVDSVMEHDFSRVVLTSGSEVATVIEHKEENWNIILEGMHSSSAQNYNTTTARVFRDAGYDLGSKTGTPETSSGSSHSTFVAFAPYEQPEVAVCVYLEHAGSSSKVVPIGRDVLDAYFASTEGGDTVPQEGALQ